MANKENTTTPLPSDVGNSFDREEYILTYKPTIDYEEPAQEPGGVNPVTQETSPLEDARNRAQQIVDNYKVITNLTDLAQKRIDSRVNANGGFSVELDPAKDAHVIAALKRCFPEATNHNAISYEMYKHCLARMNQASGDIPQVTQEEIQSAKEDPLRVDFGGLNTPPGLNRSDITQGGIKPIDLTAFQVAGVLMLFKLMLPLIKREDKAEVLQHLATAPHKPI